MTKGNVIGKGEAEHAPSPLQQEPDDATRRNALQAGWSEATKMKPKGSHAHRPRVWSRVPDPDIPAAEWRTCVTHRSGP
jgi:hypothetical protein